MLEYSVETVNSYGRELKPIEWNVNTITEFRLSPPAALNKKFRFDFSPMTRGEHDRPDPSLIIQGSRRPQPSKRVQGSDYPITPLEELRSQGKGRTHLCSASCSIGLIFSRVFERGLKWWEFSGCQF